MADRLHRTLVTGTPVRFHITGLEELEQQLQSLPQKFARKAIRDSLRPAAELIRKEMQQLARRATGWMAEHITLRVSSSGQDRGRAAIGFSAAHNPERHQTHVPGAINEALWNEFGTRKMAARPFIRPAFDAKKEEALELIIRKLREHLEEAAR